MKRSHWVLMLLCCLIPLAAIAAIVLFRVPTSSALYVGLMLMCPLLHLLMMRGMRHDHATTSTAVGHRHEPACHNEAGERAEIVAPDPRPGEAAPGMPTR